MLRKSILSCCGALAFMVLAQTGEGKAQPAPAQQVSRASGVPDDYKLNLMIRNAVIALNQANMTGNYSVLRDLGTPSFQVANKPAKLAEIFGALRERKLDFSPVMFFNPKLLAPPSFQDGQILRLTGFFPTVPEQVNFDLAFQMLDDQWLIAGIAVSTVAASEAQRSDQIASLPSPQTQGARNSAEAGKPAGEAKPIRIDLSQPALAPPAQHKKPVPRKPKPPVQQTVQAAPSAAPAPAPTPVEPAASQPLPEPAPAPPPPQPQPEAQDKLGGWNPFAR